MAETVEMEETCISTHRVGFPVCMTSEGLIFTATTEIRSCKLNFYSRFKFESTNIPNCVVLIAVWNNGQRNVLLGASRDRDIRNKEGETI